jgi:hypothetical protein
MPTLSFSDSEYTYGWWNGERLGSLVGWDCETALIAELPSGDLDPLSVPELSLSMAFDGKSLFLIHPSKLADFLTVNAKTVLVGHNVQFDFWVSERYLRRVGELSAVRKLWDAGDQGRLRDTMILDLLLQLGTGRIRKVSNKKDDEKLYSTNLGVLAAQYAVGELDKEDPFRMRYGELVGLSEAEIEAHPEFLGFATYALKDVIATRAVYEAQTVESEALVRSVGWSPKKRDREEIWSDAPRKWGWLTEQIQVRASIALAELSRTPLKIDRAARNVMEARVREEYDKTLVYLEETAPGLWKRYKKSGAYMVTKRTGVPRMVTSVLVEKLTSEAKRLEVPVPISDGKKKGVSTSAKAWTKYAGRSEWIERWVELEQQAKLLEHLKGVDAEYVYSRYSLLMRTGRTSAGAYRSKKGIYFPSVNVQQMPKVEGFRDLFLATPGTLRVGTDYSYIELRTLAACCRTIFGKSELEATVREHTLHGGLDPHHCTAINVLGVSREEYLLLDEAVRKKARQSAKIFNFAFGGGMGIETFRASALAQYNVSYSAEEAKKAKAAWIKTYPEMADWLGDRTVAAIRYQTGAKIPDSYRLRFLSDLARGKELSDSQASSAWALVEEIGVRSNRRSLRLAAEDRTVTDEVKNLTLYRACTPTGRVRANTKYTDSCNTPFQGLAADGAKEALWKLYYVGYKPVLFVHDEIVVDVPVGKAFSEGPKIAKIMNEAMNSVLGGIPSATGQTIATYWKKD